MAQVQRALASRVRRVMAAIAILLGVVTAVPFLSGTASAHHPTITASTACNGTISWTSVAWAGDGTNASRINSDIKITLSIVSGSGAAPAAIHGAYSVANNFQFSGTFTWPTGATSIKITALAVAAWGNGSGGGSSTDTGTMTPPTGCGSNPSVTKTISCVAASPGNGDGKVVLTLTNNGSVFGSSAAFKVYNPDQTVTSTTYNVANGGSTNVTFTGINPDGNHSIKITVGATDLSQTFTIDCDSPVPSVSNAVSCAGGDGKIVVTLSNTGGDPVTFAVTPPTGGNPTNYPVAANGSSTVTFTGLADGAYTVVITIGGAHYDQSFTVDCDHPAPVVTSAASCDVASHDGKVVVTLANTAGTEAAIFHVTNPFTNAVEDVTVAAGGTTTRTFSGFSDGQRSVHITVSGDNTNYDQSFTVACDLAPSYQHSEACVSGDGTVNVDLTNDGDDVNATFVLEGTTYTVAPGATKTVAFAGLSDGSHSFTLTINGVDNSFQVTVDCDRPGQPAVEVAQACADEDGSVAITLKNVGGQLSLTFVVDGQNHVVPANSSVIVNVTGLTDGPHTITITQGQTDFSQQVTVNCDAPPTVEHSYACAAGDNGHSDGSVVVTLHNNGDDTSVTFTVNGTEHVVGPKASAQVTISGLADGSHTIAVAGGGLDFSFTVDVACDHPGTPSVSSSQSCADHDGTVVVHLTATGGEQAIAFTVNGSEVAVQPDTTVDVTINGLTDGSHHIAVSGGGSDFSFDVTVACDLPPATEVSSVCSAFDGQVSISLINQGDDVAVTFTVNGVDHVVAPGATEVVVVSGLSDGQHSITLSINGVPQAPIAAGFDCDPVFSATAVCNTVDIQGAVSLYWYTITNTEASALQISWDGGSATVPAGGSLQVASNTAPLSLQYNGGEIATASAAGDACTRHVTFTKELIGQPPTGETYTILVSRLVGADYQSEVQFDLEAGVPKTIDLPSTLDPNGIQYKIEEIDAGTASTSTISPDQLKLTGNLGETISVVVTNGYASVQIDKQSLTANVVAGGEITYTLQATNTGGLTLDPVVITDRLPGQVEYVSVSVADNGGTCVLAEAGRPQLLVCSMADALPAGGVTKVITLTVKVDASVASGTTILNQAKVLGSYVPVQAGKRLDGLDGQAVDTDLSCLPAIAGTVCDLSAKVGTPVTEVGQESPSTTTTTISHGGGGLPPTGSSSPVPMLAIALGAAGLGAAMLLVRRRAAS